MDSKTDSRTCFVTELPCPKQWTECIGCDVYINDKRRLSQGLPGWQCPICGTVYAPWVDRCSTFHGQITTSTTGNYTVNPNPTGYTTAVHESLTKEFWQRKPSVSTVTPTTLTTGGVG